MALAMAMAKADKVPLNMNVGWVFWTAGQACTPGPYGIVITWLRAVHQYTVLGHAHHVLKTFVCNMPGPDQNSSIPLALQNVAKPETAKEIKKHCLTCHAAT